ncbi:inorganic diphosphatase [Mycoplasma suis]|uniref:inorganic diphosphatase n=1 Tax=Mycoplasma suis (strain Illinois) TaxID=768700 RepID=F0QS38_MYCSL|nr:inorganic diphosphatase [Mycoplasma suis]ADX98308.1 inorganic pyrophosphatase [Mycoplasma suis str. Illinois]
MSKNNIVECFIEIAKHSNLKYECVDGKLKLDRVLFGSMVYPHNYGYISDTLAEDGDPLDVVVLSNFSVTPGTYLDCKILGSLEMVDSGEQDWKVIAIMDADPRLKHINSLDDVPQHWIAELRNFFESYKQLENKKVSLGNFISLEFTLSLIEESKTRWRTQRGE